MTVTVEMENCTQTRAETLAQAGTRNGTQPGTNLGAAPEASDADDFFSHASGTAYEFRVLDSLILLSRRRGFLLRSTLSVGVLASIAALLLPNHYTATTNILPPQQSTSLAASMLGQLGALGPVAALAQKDLGLKNPNDIYVGMLRSRRIEDALIRRFDLLRVYHDQKMSAARKDLEEASAIVLGKEGFLSVSVEDRDPARAAAIANAYAEQLRAVTQDLAVTEAGQRRIFFERQLELGKNRLAEAEQALKETQQKTGLIQLDGQAKAIIESVVKLRALIAAKEVELIAMRLFSTDQNPDYQRAEQQVVGLRQQLVVLERQSGGPGELQVAAGNVPEAGLEYVRKLREVKVAEAIFEILTKQYEGARLDEAKSAAVIQVLDPAIEPDRKSWPPRAWIVLLATLLGCLGSVGYVALEEAFRQMRLDPAVEARWSTLKNTLKTSWKPAPKTTPTADSETRPKNSRWPRPWQLGRPRGGSSA
jgi:uncharacterized protein involved in exopolysaccharide biosynthesis